MNVPKIVLWSDGCILADDAEFSDTRVDRMTITAEQQAREHLNKRYAPHTINEAFKNATNFLNKERKGRR